ncbi:putative uncharacterized protein [Clostridium sp. CAG:1013]|jgi:putative aldouronate transport system substrate-binding protein|nr:putative uncharacterized protein [Clostridium sp. CAG:1013]
MKKFRKPIALLLAVLMGTSLLTGCTGSSDSGSGTSQEGGESSATVSQTDGNFNAEGFPIVNEKVTKHFMINKPAHIGNPDDMVTLQKYEEMTNVDVEWEVVSSDGFSERVNLVMASDSMPDAILKGVPDITKTSADGSIIDISGLIDEYSVGIKSLYDQYPEVYEASKSPDGGIYAVPNINTLVPNRTNHRNLWINQTWLDNLGLETPETLDEYLDVLRAFRDEDANGNGDPSDEIPYVVEYSGGDHRARVNIFLGSWGIHDNLGYEFLTIQDDKVNMYVIDDTYKEVLQFMNTMWTEGLLDNSLYTQTNDVALSKFNSDVSGSFALSSDDLWSAYSEDYSPLAPPTNSNGDTPVIGLNSAYGGAAMVITRSDESPEITLRWIDYFFTEEGANFIGALSPDLEGITCQKMEDGSYDYSDEILNSDKGVSMAVGEVCPLPGGGFPYWRNENNSDFIYSKKVQESVPVYEPYYQTDPAYAYPVFSVEDAEVVNDIRRDLDTYLKECEAKFITGEMSFDQWDEYVATCEQMRIHELEEIFQAAYDRMKESA